jgi:hypothetical protein
MCDYSAGGYLNSVDEIASNDSSLTWILKRVGVSQYQMRCEKIFDREA